MDRKGRKRLRTVAELVARTYPEVDDPAALVRRGGVLVDGRVATNPASLVPDGVSVVLRRADVLRGERKLRTALAAFGVRVAGRVALDLGAAAGGFTRVVLEHGAARVYAVDAGFGQLLGSLRQDPRVVNLERTNLAALTTRIVPDTIGLVTADLSYVSLGAALPQLSGRVELSRDAELVALVKPQFELGLSEPPADSQTLADALRRATAGIIRAGWDPVATMESPVAGARGAREFFVHGRSADLPGDELRVG